MTIAYTGGRGIDTSIQGFPPNAKPFSLTFQLCHGKGEKSSRYVEHVEKKRLREGY